MNGRDNNNRPAESSNFTLGRKLESIFKSSLSSPSSHLSQSAVLRKPVRRKPIPRMMDDSPGSASNSHLPDTINNSSHDIVGNESIRSGSTSSLSIASSFRRRKASQASSLGSLDTLSKPAPKASDIMSHLTEHQLADLLEEMLDTMGLEEDKRKAVRAMPKDSKWMMVFQHLQKQDGAPPVAAAAFAKGSPEYYARQLKEYLVKGISSSGSAAKTLNAIRVSIGSQPLTWVRTFIEREGLSHLLELLKILTVASTSSNKTASRRDGHFILEMELVRCIKAFMNNQNGLKEIMKRAPGSIHVLAQSLRSLSFPVKKQIAELLTVVCYTDSPHGHRLVLDALNAEHATPSDDSEKLYQTWLLSLLEVIGCRDKIGNSVSGGLVAGVGWIGENRVTEKEIIEFLVSHMILLNSLVGMPSDVDYRMHIRNLFISAGFSNILSKLKDLCVSNEFIRRQVEQFNTSLSSDWAEYSQDFQELQLTERDPLNILSSLIRQVEGTRGANHLLSILQHLLSIRKEPSVRSAYLHLIDIVITQIVLNGKGIDPDFSSLYPIDLGIIIDNFVHHDDLSRVNHENSLLKQMVDSLLQDKSQLEDHIDMLKLSRDDQIDSAVKAPAQLARYLADHHKRILGIFEHLRALPADLIDEELKKKMLANLQHSDTARIFMESAPSNSHETDQELVKSTSSHDLATGKESGKSYPPPPPPAPSIVIPPPPPFPEMFGAPPGPPPPPGQGFMRRPPKAAAYAPRLKLKQMQWTKIADHEIKQTFWNKLDDQWICDRLAKAGIWTELESQFSDSRALGVDQGKGDRVRTPTSVSSASAAKEISVLEYKKSYNLLILLSRLRNSLSELANAITNMDALILSPTLVQQFLNYVPTAEEVGLLTPYIDEVSKLALPERFMIELMRVDRCSLRLKCMNFNCTFEEAASDLEKTLVDITSAIDAVEESNKFRDFLQLLLVFGNVMNGKGFRGGAYGFKLSSLNSLQSTKSSSGQTLLDFVVSIIFAEFPDILDIKSELEPVSFASRASLQFAQDEYHSLLKNVRHLENELSKSPILDSDPLAKSRDGIRRASGRLDKANEKLNSCCSRFEELVISFGDDPKDMTTEDWFGSLKSFLSAFTKSIDQLTRSNEESLKSPPASHLGDNDSSPMKSMNWTRSSDSPEKSFASTGEEKGVMDTLLESLRNGTGPAHHRREPAKFAAEGKTPELRRISHDFATQAHELLIQLNNF